ncbi:MAG: hypothetical protein D6784_12875 [Chloroflexi bacterium]|nr:MAG: hypothetical protein D6784_12875 [Chloroflexota bacterium]
MNKLANHRRILWLEWGLLILILAVATWLRYWRIEEVPPGFNSDEAVGAMGALTTLREGIRYSYEGQGGGGSLGFYFAALFFYLFGPSIATIRGLAAWAGLVSIFAHYWAVREMFRPLGLPRARWLAGLSTLGLTLSHWHISSSRIAFAGIGVPFLMMPSVYFLWLGLNRLPDDRPVELRLRWLWPFLLSGLFLGSLMYIYLSGVFAPPLYAAFFIAQWLVVWLTRRRRVEPVPPYAYLTRRFWFLAATALVAALLLIPMAYILLTRPELEPGTTRVSQAIFLNPQINNGDPWGLLWRSIVGNFAAYGISPLWLIGRTPRLAIPAAVGLATFLGFLIAFWQGVVRARAAYLFIWLWVPVMLLPSILAPDAIPHNLRALGASPGVYTLAAIFVVWLYEQLWQIGRRWLAPRLSPRRWRQTAAAGAVALALLLAWPYAQGVYARLYYYFYIFPTTNDAEAAYHVYAVKMAEVINQEPRGDAAFLLLRNTAAGEVYPNFTTNFLTELAQPPAAHYWLVDDERTLAADLTTAAAEHRLMRVVHWKTSKHTGADPKEVVPYYLEKFGHFVQTDRFKYFDIDTYMLDTPAPDFQAAESLTPVAVDFGSALRLTGYALGDAGDPAHVTDSQAASGDLLWLRLAWQKLADYPENLKVSALLYTPDGQLVGQMDKLLLNNIWQVGTTRWETGIEEYAYFLFPIPPATPPGDYRLKLAVYGADSLARLPVASPEAEPGNLLPLAGVTVIPARQPVDPSDLPLALPLNRTLAPGLTLVGFETLPGETIRSGDRVGASLIWQAGDPPPEADWQMQLVVDNGGAGQPVSEPVGLAGSLPSSQWRPGDVLRGWLMARVPPALNPGQYALSLHLTASTGQTVSLPLGEFQVTGWPRVFDPPQPRITLSADFAGQTVLVGLDLEARQVAPGGILPVRLYWQAAAEFEQDYTAFVHLVGPDGRLYGQVDQTPGAGAYPTTGWLPGEYITDAYEIPVSSDAPAGAYRLEIGMYSPATGERLPVTPPDCQTQSCAYSDNRVLVDGVEVRP